MVLLNEVPPPPLPLTKFPFPPLPFKIPLRSADQRIIVRIADSAHPRCGIACGCREEGEGDLFLVGGLVDGEAEVGGEVVGDGGGEGLWGV